MTGLLPDIVREAVRAKSPLTATAFFGAAAMVLLIVLLVELQLVAGQGRSGQARVLRAVVEPLLGLGVLILAVRLVAIAS
jgi:ABC-type antimicrobial peptide transport system permease subunit